MEPSQGFIDAGEVRLHYLEWAAAAPHPPPRTAVLLHATGFLARPWQPVAEALSARHHVYAYDARGHGDSDKPHPGGSGYTWDRFTDDLKGFLDVLGLRRVLAVGHSMGGATAAALAAAEPDYVSAAVLIEPIVFPPVPDEVGEERRRELSSGAARRRMVWSSPRELVQAYRKRPVFAGWRDDVLRLYAEHGTFRRPDGRYELKCPAEIEARTFDNNISHDTWSRLPDIRCPALVLHGERTERELALAAAAVARRIPGARLATISGAGHMAPMERPDAVAAQILRFLDPQGGPK